jgi:Flp pilus assembly protein TadG
MLPGGVLTYGLRRFNLAAMKRRRSGSNIIEFALIVPWYVFLFVGSFDMGLYSYALITVENAARIAAMHCSASLSAVNDGKACTLAIDQLQYMPATVPTVCTGNPLTVSATAVSGPEGIANSAAQVVVTYVMPALPGIPGLLPGRYTLSRTVTMKIGS